MSRRLLTLSAIALLAAAALAPVANAEERPPAGKDNCFYLRDWEGWKSPSPNVIYLRVGADRIYRFDLADNSPQLSYADARLVNGHQYSPWICSPQDLFLTLTLVNQPGFAEHLFVRSITRLSPDEVAAIPAKFRP